MVTIESAPELRRIPTGRQLRRAPRTFSASLDELYSGSIEPNLPDAATVEAFHSAFADYPATPDPLHLLRQSRGMERRETYRTADGTRLKATDNAPAWWTQYALLQGCRVAPDKFGRVVETMPAHMFDVRRTLPSSASGAGWHIAHLFNVKDRRTDYENWSRREVAARFVRNIHPCNHLLLPKTDWRRWGGDERVLAFFGDVYADRYATVWRAYDPTCSRGSPDRCTMRSTATPRRLMPLLQPQPRAEAGRRCRGCIGRRRRTSPTTRHASRSKRD